MNPRNTDLPRREEVLNRRHPRPDVRNTEYVLPPSFFSSLFSYTIERSPFRRCDVLPRENNDRVQ